MSFQVDIRDEVGWNNEIVGTPGLLQVVEVYQGWSGPSRAVQGIFKRIYFDMSDSPLKFYTACADTVPQLAQYKESCEPTFLFYKDAKELSKITGVKPPELSKEIMSLLDNV